MPPKRTDKRFLYLAERDQTFLGTATPRGKEVYQWPHVEPTGTQMAEAGFYFTPTKIRRDQVTCFHCKKKFSNIHLDPKEIYSWHFEQSPDCYYAKLLVLKFSTESPPSDFSIQQFKDLCLKTYHNWPHEHVEGLSSALMSDAGMFYAPSNEGDDSVSCGLCGVELDGWEPADDPWEEHQKSSPNCFLFVPDVVSPQQALVSETIADQEVEDISTQDEEDDSYTYIESDREMSSPIKTKIAASIHSFKRRRRQKYGIMNSNKSRELELSDDEFHSSSIPQIDMTNEDNEPTRKRKIDTVTKEVPKVKRSALLDASDDSIQFSVSPNKNNTKLKSLEISMLDKKESNEGSKFNTPDIESSLSSPTRLGHQNLKLSVTDVLASSTDSQQEASNGNSLDALPEQVSPDQISQHFSQSQEERIEDMMVMDDVEDQISEPFPVSPEEIHDVELADDGIQKQPESFNHSNPNSMTPFTAGVFIKNKSPQREPTLRNVDIQVVEDSQVSGNQVIPPTEKGEHIDNNSKDRSSLQGESTTTKTMNENSQDLRSKIAAFILEKFALHGNQGLGEQITSKASLKVGALKISDLISSPVLLDEFQYIKCREPDRKDKYISYSFYYSQIGLGTSTLKAATHKLAVKIYFNDPSVWHLKAVRMGKEYFSELYAKNHPFDSSILKIPASEPNHSTKEQLDDIHINEEEKHSIAKRPTEEQLDDMHSNEEEEQGITEDPMEEPLDDMHANEEEEQGITKDPTEEPLDDMRANEEEVQGITKVPTEEPLDDMHANEEEEQGIVQVPMEGRLRHDNKEGLISTRTSSIQAASISSSLLYERTNGSKINSQMLKKSLVQSDASSKQPIHDDTGNIDKNTVTSISKPESEHDISLNEPKQNIAQISHDVVFEFADRNNKEQVINSQETKENPPSQPNRSDNLEPEATNVSVQKSFVNGSSESMELNKGCINSDRLLHSDSESVQLSETKKQENSMNNQELEEKCSNSALNTVAADMPNPKQTLNEDIKPTADVQNQTDETSTINIKPQPEQTEMLSEQQMLTVHSMVNDTFQNDNNAAVGPKGAKIDENQVIEPNQGSPEALKVLVNNLAPPHESVPNDKEPQPNITLSNDVIDDTKDNSHTQRQTSTTGSTVSEAKTPAKVSSQDKHIHEGGDHLADHLNLNSSCARMSFKTSPLGLSTSPNAFLEIDAPELKEAKESKLNQLWKKCDRKSISDSLDQFNQSAELLKKITESPYQGLSDDMDGLLTAFIAEMPEEELNMTIKEWCIHSAQQSKALLEATYEKMIKKFQDEAENALTILRDLEVDDD